MGVACLKDETAGIWPSNNFSMMICLCCNCLSSEMIRYCKLVTNASRSPSHCIFTFGFGLKLAISAFNDKISPCENQQSRFEIYPTDPRSQNHSKATGLFEWHWFRSHLRYILSYFQTFDSILCYLRWLFEFCSVRWPRLVSLWWCLRSNHASFGISLQYFPNIDLCCLP